VLKTISVFGSGILAPQKRLDRILGKPIPRMEPTRSCGLASATSPEVASVFLLKRVVRENLMMGSYREGSRPFATYPLERWYGYFPSASVSGSAARAGHLSGGEHKGSPSGGAAD